MTERVLRLLREQDVVVQRRNRRLSVLGARLVTYRIGSSSGEGKVGHGMISLGHSCAL